MYAKIFQGLGENTCLLHSTLKSNAPRASRLQAFVLAMVLGTFDWLADHGIGACLTVCSPWNSPRPHPSERVEFTNQTIFLLNLNRQRAIRTNVDQNLIADQRNFRAKYLQNDEN